LSLRNQTNQQRYGHNGPGPERVLGVRRLRWGNLFDARYVQHCCTPAWHVIRASPFKGVFLFFWSFSVFWSIISLMFDVEPLHIGKVLLSTRYCYNRFFLQRSEAHVPSHVLSPRVVAVPTMSVHHRHSLLSPRAVTVTAYRCCYGCSGVVVAADAALRARSPKVSL
jgi:hypothetical protein